MVAWDVRKRVWWWMAACVVGIGWSTDETVGGQYKKQACVLSGRFT
jgi:hypothetical protein